MAFFVSILSARRNRSGKSTCISGSMAHGQKHSGIMKGCLH
jgi:hypothetical protein